MSVSSSDKQFCPTQSAVTSSTIVTDFFANKTKLTVLYETVNTVCLGFSHEFTQFCQSWFYLQNGVKKVLRITYYWQRLHFIDCRAVFDLSAYFYPGHVTLFGHLTRKQHVYQNQKEEAGNFNREILGCGAIKNTRFVAQLNISLID